MKLTKCCPYCRTTSFTLFTKGVHGTCRCSYCKQYFPEDDALLVKCCGCTVEEKCEICQFCQSKLTEVNNNEK